MLCFHGGVRVYCMLWILLASKCKSQQTILNSVGFGHPECLKSNKSWKNK